MKITFYGHSSFGIYVGGKFILVDPYISENPKASHININELKPNYILLTHAHQDHILDVDYIAQNNPDALIVSNYEEFNFNTIYYCNYHCGFLTKENGIAN